MCSRWVLPLDWRVLLKSLVLVHIFLALWASGLNQLMHAATHALLWLYIHTTVCFASNLKVDGVRAFSQNACCLPVETDITLLRHTLLSPNAVPKMGHGALPHNAPPPAQSKHLRIPRFVLAGYYYFVAFPKAKKKREKIRNRRVGWRG